MDKTSKKVINYIKKLPNGRLQYYDNNLLTVAVELKLDIDVLQACIRYLVEQGYLEHIKSNGCSVGIILSHKAIHNKEFKKIDFINYLKDKWISIVAMIISITSLLISIINSYK